jgi:crotonobetainyl-CoA:carnitine CoA-transferase CaiB-like acyl-CoA transferase
MRNAGSPLSKRDTTDGVTPALAATSTIPAKPIPPHRLQRFYAAIKGLTPPVGRNYTRSRSARKNVSLEGLAVPSRPTVPTIEPPLALDGLRVLDFTQMMLGPFATQMLADLGADVIKVERPVTGEWERGLQLAGQLLGGDSAGFLAMNRNKRSIAVDLKAPGAAEALRALGATCDVVVENFRPGVMDRLGLGYADFRSVRPDIIYCSGSGWGQRSTFAKENRPGQDLLIQAASGLAYNAGTADDPPIAAGTSVSDATAALTLSNGILAAVIARDRYGIGQRVEVDLFRSTMAILCQEAAVIVNQTEQPVRSAAGVAQPWLSAPAGIYRSADGWFALAMSDLHTVAGVFELPHLGELDPWSDRDTVKRTIDAVSPSRTTAQWVTVLLDAGLWAGKVQTTAEAVDDLRVMDPDMIVTVEHPIAGAVELLACPITLSETPWRQRLPPPRVGEHTDEVFAGVIPDETVAVLRATGVIS